MEALAAPADASPVLETLARIHAEVASIHDGEVATYIPELAKANPDWFGICLATANGALYEVGDTRIPFTIQSISKPFVYGLALEDNGRASVLEKVGVEPTGDAFNSISLEPGTGRPRNPMINAGAIATTGLVAGKSLAFRLQRILETLGHCAGHLLTLDEEVYRSESATGHRNRAIGHMLRNFGILTTDPMPVVDLYFQQCSISVTCRDLAVMAATLANRGVNPLTGRTALRGEYVESVLSVMETCGMYNSAGDWVYRVGMPAKSGVAGGILAVLPGQLGIGVFSPPLDPCGNSTRGVRVCQDLSRHLDLHLLNRPAIGQLTLRRQLSGMEFSSSRLRTPVEQEALARLGHRLRLFQLQGNLTFSTTEVVAREVLRTTPAPTHLILDLRRVLSINECAAHLLHRLLVQLRSQGRHIALTHADHLPLLHRHLRRKAGADAQDLPAVFPDNDRALEWAENALLAEVAPAAPVATGPAAPTPDLLLGLTPSQLALVQSRLASRPFRTGETLVETGASADEMFLLREGSVSVMLPLPDGSQRRLATFTAGMAFGEMGMLDRAPRSARIVAETDGVCDILRRTDFEALGQDHPDILVAILRSLCLGLSARLRKANAERSALD